MVSWLTYKVARGLRQKYLRAFTNVIGVFRDTVVVCRGTIGAEKLEVILGQIYI